MTHAGDPKAGRPAMLFMRGVTQGSHRGGSARSVREGLTEGCNGGGRGTSWRGVTEESYITKATSHRGLKAKFHCPKWSPVLGNDVHPCFVLIDIHSFTHILNIGSAIIITLQTRFSCWLPLFISQDFFFFFLFVFLYFTRCSHRPE